MQLLPENKKKLRLLIIVLVVAVGGIVYLNFIKPRIGGGTGGTEVVSEAVTAEAEAAKKSLLPYGSGVDLRILSQDEFRSLKAAPKVSVSPEELGNPDPFAP